MKRRGPSKPKLICIGGRSGSGKDTIASILVSRLDFVRIAIADPLKEALGSLFGLTNEQLWGDDRDDMDQRIRMTPRRLFQEFGDFTRCIDPDIWVGKWIGRVEDALAAGSSVVCSDLRTVEELATARQLGAKCWLVVRAGRRGPAATDNHLSEVTLPTQQNDFDHVIRNAGTREALEREVLRVLAGRWM